jgi:hypothetical protein
MYFFYSPPTSFTFLSSLSPTNLLCRRWHQTVSHVSSFPQRMRSQLHLFSQAQFQAPTAAPAGTRTGTRRAERTASMTVLAKSGRATMYATGSNMA